MGQTKICRYCGQVLYKDAQTCEYCGGFLFKPHDNPELYCKKCKAPVNTDDNFCQRCGAIFNIPDDDINETPQKGNLSGIPYNIGILLTSFAVAFAIAVFANAGKEMTMDGYFIYFGIAFIVAELLLYIYFLPTIIAIEKNHPNTYFIYIFNLLLGITFVGWIAALVFALQSKKSV